METIPEWVKFYQQGVPATVDVPDESLVEMMERSVMRFADLPATEFFGHRMTYRELGDQVSRAAQSLADLGVKAGHRVALVLPNCPQAVVAFYAVLRIGAIVVQHNPLYTEREIRKMFEDHGATVAIAWTKAVPLIAALPRDVAPKATISVDITRAMPRHLRAALALPLPALRRRRAALAEAAPDTTAWESFLRNAPLDPSHPRPAADDVATIQYTSGTTGDPKGAVLTHRNLYSNALMGAAWMHGAEDGVETTYAILPFFHSFGQVLFLTFAVLKGQLIVIFPRFEVGLVLKAMKKSPPSIYCAVPPIYERTARAAKACGTDLSTIKWAISGAMTLPDSTVRLWEEVTSGRLVEGYGMTEMSPIALGNPFADTRRTGTIGIPFPSTLRKVVDVEDPTREITEPGVPGELLVRGPQAFQRYWRKPDETERVLLSNGWVRTGDIVTLDEDGFTTIVDRKKELIIRSGMNVSPSEVEQVLLTHPDIEECAVVGLPQVGGDEQIVAAVVMRDDQHSDRVVLREFCRERLARYKVPSRFIEVDELPKSMLGKVLRREVRSRLIG